MGNCQIRFELVHIIAEYLINHITRKALINEVLQIFLGTDIFRIQLYVNFRQT